MKIYLKFMQVIGYSLVILITSNCGKKAEVGDLVSKFESYYGYKVSIPIYFVPKMEANIVGKAYGNYKIEISEEYWNDSRTENENRECLIFHELGHAILNRGHKLTTTENNRPVSIMYPSIILDGWYKHFFNEYAEELFSIQNDMHLVKELTEDDTKVWVN